MYRTIFGILTNYHVLQDSVCNWRNNKQQIQVVFRRMQNEMVFRTFKQLVVIIYACG